MKSGLRFLGFCALCAVLLGAATALRAQIADTAVVQVTSSAYESRPTGISGNGRLVVIESTGDIATERIANVRDSSGNIVTRGRNNEDGNREIFLYDYAQRRIFQVTDTENVLKATATPTPTPTPTATPTGTPTPAPVPTPALPSSIQFEISNNQAAISYDGKWLAFSSNAPNPALFPAASADRAALAVDANQEIFLYRIPDTPADADLSAGLEVAAVNLGAGTFTQVTNTAASTPPRQGDSINGVTIQPFVAFDNRSTAISDDGSYIAFVSTRNLAVVNGLANADANPEVFVYNRPTNTTAQITATQGAQVFNENPQLSGSGTAIAFISNANIPDAGNASNNADGNAEIYWANYNGATRSNLRQVTRTASTNNISVNILSPRGRRLSRDGNLIAFESYASLESSNSAIQTTPGLYVYNVASGATALVGVRAAATDGSVLRNPSFTGDNSTLVFASSINFTADNTLLPSTATDGLNPGRNAQIFSIPVAQLSGTTRSFTRLTGAPAVGVSSPSETQPAVGETTRRIAFAYDDELGGGNADFSIETFYLLATPVTSDTPASANALTYVTGASRREIVAPTATPTPPAVSGLSPGLVTLARSTTVPLAPGARSAGAASVARVPSLPTELNGVSVTVNGAAAGLYLVGANEISFVAPSGLPATTGTNTYAVSINNNGSIVRGTARVVAVQPDIFTDATTGAGLGRALALNITNPLSNGTPEPFAVTTTYTAADGTATTAPTRLRFFLTGIANAAASQVTVRIKETDLTGTAILGVSPTGSPGISQIDVQLPESLAGAGDSAVVITVSGVTTRPAETAPRVQIN